MFFRSFYEQDVDQSQKLLIVQCESGSTSAELLDTVRYVIMEEYEKGLNSSHTVLLLSLARGQNLGSYQGKIQLLVKQNSLLNFSSLCEAKQRRKSVDNKANKKAKFGLSNS